MSDLKITQLTTLAAVPANGDWLPIVDVSDTTMSAQGTTKKIAANRFVNTNADKTFVTGDGTTGVLPVAGTVAVVSRANTFTAVQTIAPAATGVSLKLTPPASNGSNDIIAIDSYDNGTGRGPVISLGLNNNASTPAASAINFTQMDGDRSALWADAAGLFRTRATLPTNATDTTAATVVGDQTSHAEYKDIVGEPVSDAAALAALIAAADDVKRFVYKSGAYNGQEFSGIILDGATLHRYGQDADDEHPAGKALNIVNAIGDLVKAVRYLAARVEALEAS